MPNHPPSSNSLTPLNLTSDPGVAQTFTVTYSDPDGWQNISNVSFFITAGGHDNGHNQQVFYTKATNKFTLLGASGSCSPGQAATLSNTVLILSCSASAASGSGSTLTMTFSLTPKLTFLGPHPLSISVFDHAGAGNSKNTGKWTVHRSRD